MAQVVQPLPIKHDALSSNPSAAKKKEINKYNKTTGHGFASLWEKPS
jgi:hypothetical protein